ncbi:hypothetical protein LWI28_006395 [Acer negundo]|uniref:Kinesin motor domain-containing protein n=1 Tax=Acer negundo TaxID=4023 RepID=A0AAD5JIB0_ACENE|nr:hypothetical protein LWI28_006395 [Acer negundo]
MLSPLVEEFFRGKSRMLVVLGPSGSGKTYTIFKSLRDPGMVPFALQLIFEGITSIGSDSSESRRSFYLSIFKIYSERGKGERLSDLSPDGGDLFMQHATIKGLQEVIIYNAAEAEFLISRAMLRCATTMTNPNSQSRCMDMPVSPKAKSSRRSPARTRSKSVSSPSRSGSKPHSLSRSRSLLPAKRMSKSPRKRRVSRSPCGSRSRSLLTL